MYLKSLHIENFRRFERYDCGFDPRLTLLMGVNGAGKSSLLKAISIPFSTALGQLGFPKGNEFEVEDVRASYSTDPSSESWMTVGYPPILRVVFDVEGSPQALSLLRTPASWVWQQNPRADMDPPVDLDQFGHSVRTWLFGQTSKAVPVLARFGVSAFAGTARPLDLGRPFEQKRELWDRFQSDQIDVSTLAQWFQHNEFRSLQEGQEPLIFRVAKQAVLKAIHATDIKYVVRESRLMVRHEDTGWRPFDRLSDGQKRIAALFLEIAVRAASLNSHLGERCLQDAPGFVLIDELDMHLHPQWQRAVIDDLLETFPRLQFVVASHSPFLIQSALERGIVIDACTGDRVDAMDHSIEDIAETVMGVDQPQRSQRFLEKRQLAQEYLELMESPTSTPEEREALKHRLDGALAEFADDPASAAWLKMQSLSKGL
ncbi:AAA family ATPase [Roseateles sp. L2-2]|uniref:AAA family ATPase n=1 Tax=Roseateles sp. L2-2 TaxID=3422597 RepID=UPI003D35F370